MTSPKNIVLGIVTPFGPTTLFLTVEEFTAFVEALNTILENIQDNTPVPKVFEDAFSKEGKNGDTD